MYESRFYWFVLTGESAIPEMQKQISRMTTIITIIILSYNFFLYQFKYHLLKPD